MVNIAKVQKGIASFLDNEMMSKLPDGGLQKVIVGVMSALIIRKGDTAIDMLKANPIAIGLGVFDGNGDMDLDLLKDVIKENIPDTGLKINLPIVGGMTVFKEDIDSLHRHIVNAEV